MTQPFSIETHQYRNGQKPLDIHLMIGANRPLRPIMSVTPDGEIKSHDLKGRYYGYGNLSELDLVPIPKPPTIRGWNCPDDVPEEANWVQYDSFRVSRLITGVSDEGIYLGSSVLFWPWQALIEQNARWSATRRGEYRPCTVEVGG